MRAAQGNGSDGAIRDVGLIRHDKLPVFARAVVPNAGGAEYRGELGIPVQCAGAVVSPGNWIVSDEDGVVVVPRDRLEATIGAAERLLTVEIKIQREIERGKDLAVLRYDEVVASKAATGGSRR